MEKNILENLIKLRSTLINQFEKLRDYKNNPNAIMKERDHAKVIHQTIVSLDTILKDHLSFSDKN
jgi:hypothetical protein